MPNYYANLPAPEFRNALLDLSPVNNALEGVRQQNNANRNALMQQDERDYQRGRDAKQDERVAVQDNWQKVQRAGQIASTIQQMPDNSPGKVAAWQKYLQDYGDGNHGPEELDFRTGPAIAAAAAGKWNDPRDSRMKDLDLQHKQAQINQLNQRADGGGDFSKRATAAQTLGIDPNSDAYKSYVLTGRLPREDQQSLTATDKKAILEADDMVGSNRSAIQAIDEASRLNPKANSGWFAGARAAAGANLPDALVPDWISSPESSAATIDFDNAVVGQALTSLKSIFGGNPTEGERKILLDLQGSSGKPQAVRAEILARARRAAVNRMSLNEQRAQELRGGGFYKPGGGAAAANPMTYNSAGGDPLAEAKAAISRGADPAKVMERLQQMGIDPRGLQ